AKCFLRAPPAWMSQDVHGRRHHHRCTHRESLIAQGFTHTIDQTSIKGGTLRRASRKRCGVIFQSTRDLSWIEVQTVRTILPLKTPEIEFFIVSRALNSLPDFLGVGRRRWLGARQL